MNIRHRKGCLSDQIFIFDGHNDLPFAMRTKFQYDLDERDLNYSGDDLHTDIPALHSGNVGAQFWSLYVPSTGNPVVGTLEQADFVFNLCSSYSDSFYLAESAKDVSDAIASGRIACLMGMEGGHSIDGSLGALRMMRSLGVRYMTLTHNDNTFWAASATGAPVEYGLTGFGRSVVREMNRIGMIVDLSHVHYDTMNDALDVSSKPVMFSHSSCRAVNAHPRNVPDDVLVRLADNNGILMLTFVPSFVSDVVYDYILARDRELSRLGLDLSMLQTQRRPSADSGSLAAFERWTESNPKPVASLEDVVAHFEHAREIVGVEHLGVGGDFDGIPSGCLGLERVSEYPALISALRDKKWSYSDLTKLGFGNILRVLKDNDL